MTEKYSDLSVYVKAAWAKLMEIVYAIQMHKSWMYSL